VKFVMLEYAYDKDDKRKVPTPPLHVYEQAPGLTLCGLTVGLEAYGWYAGGGSLDSPHFPWGPICPKCRAEVAAKNTKGGGG